jgi:hypothetical protein
MWLSPYANRPHQRSISDRKTKHQGKENKMTRNLARRVAALAFVVLCLPVAAQVPRVLSYQGYLSTSAGQPFPNGSTPVVFRLYTTLTGGSAIWTESQNVEVVNGAFSTTLGSTVAFDPTQVPFDRLYYLEVTVNGASGLQAMSPRQPLSAAPYAIRAAGLSASSCAVGSAVTGFNSLGAPICDPLKVKGQACNPGSPDGLLSWAMYDTETGSLAVCNTGKTHPINPTVKIFRLNQAAMVARGSSGLMGTITYLQMLSGSTITVWAECDMREAAALSDMSLRIGDYSPPTMGLGATVNGQAFRGTTIAQLSAVVSVDYSPSFTLGLYLENPSSSSDAYCYGVTFRVIETPR